MKRLALAVFAVVVAASFFAASSFAADQAYSKVGIVNLQKIITESKSGKDARANFEKDLEGKRATLASKEKAAKAIEDDLKANGAKMKADARMAKESQLADQVKELRRLGQDMDEDLKKKDNELTSKVLTGILETIKKVGDEKGFTLIIQASPQIVYLNQASDITDEVLKRYDSGR